MPKNLDQTGVLQVNGAWATSVKYESEVLGSRGGTVDLRFMQGRAEIARVSLSSDEVSTVIGEKNATSILKHLASDADKYLAVVKGELRGARLHYQAVRIEENGIEKTRERAASALPAEAKATEESLAATQGAAAYKPEAQTSLEESKTADKKTSSVPQHIVAKYLVKHDKYYFDDQTVAFIDRGSRLTVQTQNTAVIKDLVEIAQSRGWKEVQLTGSTSFKRDTWKEAYAAGLQVSGYSPSALELESAQRAQSRRADLESTRTHDPADPVAVSPAAAVSRRSPRRLDPSRGVIYGTLIDHGVAPYRNDPNKSLSYFVTLKDESLVERTHWGVGLEDAIRQARSNPKVGEEVGLRRVGSTPVTIVGHASGEDGRSPIATKRHQWIIETAEFLKNQPQDLKPGTSSEPKNQESATAAKRAGLDPTQSPGTVMTPAQEAAAAIRSAQVTREELQLKYPELDKAVFRTLESHERFADAYIKAKLIRESDRAQVIGQLRERLASKLERNELVREPNGVNTLIRRSVTRVAADIGRTPVVVEPQRQTPARGEAQVRV